MEAAATINVRMPEQLKRGGVRVLERNGVSPTEVVRSLYRYMEREQSIPECLDVAPNVEHDVYQNRRMLLRSFDDCTVDSYDPDCKKDRACRIEEKYGDLL